MLANNFHERRNRSTLVESAENSFQSRDPETGINSVKIFAGDWYVTNKKDEMLVTILGSCVSACIRDPFMQLGGMNHFLLPGDVDSGVMNDAARYGVNAMESLINGILKSGGHKDRLEIKVFGGGNVTNNSSRIGSKNAAFIRQFLEDEGYSITSEDLEGPYPRRLHYYPATGKVMMRKLQRQEDFKVVEVENTYRNALIKTPQEGDIDLF